MPNTTSPRPCTSSHRNHVCERAANHSGSHWAAQDDDEDLEWRDEASGAVESDDWADWRETAPAAWR